MASRPFILKSETTELVMPIPPAEYQLSEGNTMEIINLHEIGDYPATGYDISEPIPLTFLLPNNAYPFSRASSSAPYLRQLKQWRAQKTLLRFIIGGTDTNIPVEIESLQYGETDGTNDITLQLVLRPKPALKVVTVSKKTKARAPIQEKPSTSSYIVVAGDTLSAICWRFYGNATPNYWQALAAKNGIANPHLIFPGQVLKVPKPLL